MTPTLHLAPKYAIPKRATNAMEVQTSLSSTQTDAMEFGFSGDQSDISVSLSGNLVSCRF